MKRHLLTSWFFVLAIVMGKFEASAAISATRVAAGLTKPTYVTSPIGDSDRLFITEQHTGKIKILNLQSGIINPTPFLTVTGLSLGGDQGLLSMAFHPDYASNGLLYTVSTDANGDEIIQQFQVSDDPHIANPIATPVIKIPYGAQGHYGGWIGFNPRVDPMDPQYLYMTTGDGPGQFDVGDDAQNLNSKFGKILRIDVNGDDFPSDSNRNYSIPASNPFVDEAGDDEIWAYGLRNPWRASFDRLTGDFYIADVGFNNYEEINFQSASLDGDFDVDGDVDGFDFLKWQRGDVFNPPRAEDLDLWKTNYGKSLGGENYGWRLREGFHETPSGSIGGPKPPGAVDPIFEYDHSVGVSITGGYVYRGSIAELQGQYFYADFPFDNGTIWSLEHDGTTATTVIDRAPELVPADVGTLDWISSFGQDGVGELYIISYGNHWAGNEGQGEVFKIITSGVALLGSTSTDVPEPSCLGLLLMAIGFISAVMWPFR